MTIPTQGEDLVLVPREPTAEMVRHGMSVADTDLYAEEVHSIYRAMISASPSREGGGSSQTSPSAQATEAPRLLAQIARGAQRSVAAALLDSAWRVMTLEELPHLAPRGFVLVKIDEDDTCTVWLADHLLAAPSSEAPPGDHGPSCTDSSGSQPQEAVKSDGPRGLGGGEL